MLLLEVQNVAFRDYLRDIGGKLDCYFTIERLADTPTSRSPFSSRDFTADGVQTIDELVAKMNKDLIGITATRDKVNPSVVHLSETALPKAEDYGMAQKATIKFQGTPLNFLVQLNKQIPSIGPRRMEGIPNQPQDHTTQMDVDVHDKLVRDLLTSAVPLKGYHRIIWEALTFDEDGKFHTDIWFYGKK